jgi:DNA repair exonuclease SbcCD ATPase subunit
MPDPQLTPTPEPQPAPAPAPTPQPPPTPGETGVQIPKQRFDEVNERMKTAEAELQKLRDAQKTADDERLANEKKFEELAQKRQTERDEWKAKAEQMTADLAALEERMHRIADERAKALPEKLQARIPAADKAGAGARLEKIEELEAVLAEVPHAPPAPGLGRAPKPAGAPNAKQQVDEAVERALRSGGYGF